MPGFRAVEAALTTARAATGRRQVVGFLGGYHGKTARSLTVTAASAFRDRLTGIPVAGLSLPLSSSTRYLTKEERQLMSPPKEDETVHAWWGRVFGSDLTGGNQTVVLRPGKRAVFDPQTTARRLAVPDTAIVVSHTDGRAVLRTFSPTEELAQCLQTSIAVHTVLGIDADKSLLVRHQNSEGLIVRREGTMTWARSARPRDLRVERPTWEPRFGGRPSDSHVPTILRQERSRIYFQCADSLEVDDFDFEPTRVLEICQTTSTNALVLYGPDRMDGIRARVFTTSLGGAEDNATGGAAMGIGKILAMGGARGQVSVRQGPDQPEKQGHLAVQISDDGSVEIGGEVATLMHGQLRAGCP